MRKYNFKYKKVEYEIKLKNTDEMLLYYLANQRFLLSREYKRALLSAILFGILAAYVLVSLSLIAEITGGGHGAVLVVMLILGGTEWYIIYIKNQVKKALDSADEIIEKLLNE